VKRSTFVVTSALLSASAVAIGTHLPVDRGPAGQCSYFDTCTVDTVNVEVRPSTVAPSRVIVSVYGSRKDGWTLGYADGHVLGIPTSSEWRAECDETPRRIQRARCNTHRRAVQTWLGKMRDSLAYSYR